PERGRGEGVGVVVGGEPLGPPRRGVGEDLLEVLERGEHHPQERGHREEGEGVEEEVVPRAPRGPPGAMGGHRAHTATAPRFRNARTWTRVRTKRTANRR